MSPGPPGLLWKQAPDGTAGPTEKLCDGQHQSAPFTLFFIFFSKLNISPNRQVDSMPMLHVIWSQTLAQMVYGIYRASHPKHHTKLRPVGAEDALEGPTLKAAEVAPGAPFPVLVAGTCSWQGSWGANPDPAFLAAAPSWSPLHVFSLSSWSWKYCVALLWPKELFAIKLKSKDLKSMCLVFCISSLLCGKITQRQWSLWLCPFFHKALGSILQVVSKVFHPGKAVAWISSELRKRITGQKLACLEYRRKKSQTQNSWCCPSSTIYMRSWYSPSPEWM